MLFKKWYFLSVMAFLCIFVLPPAAVTAQETSQVRFAHFVFNGPQVNIFVDDQVFKGEDGKPYVLNAMDLSRQYTELTFGEPHSFVVAEAGKTAVDALFKSESYTFIAGHKYALGIMGNPEAKDLHFIVMDETAALEANDPKLAAVSFLVNNLYGLPAVDLYWADQLMIENIAYGDAVAVQDATAGVGSRLTPHGDPKTVIFEYPDAIPGPPQTIAFFGFAGKFPGTIWEDFGTPYMGNFIGEPVFSDGGTIAIGDEVKVSLSEAGMRYDYKLNLDQDTVLDIMLTGDPANPNNDAFVRVLDSTGKLIVENDDIDHAVNRDAGLKGLTLSKGSYVIEATSYFDTFTGEYTLSVSASK